MRFTAFDFETCNGSSLSAVDLGIAVYEHQGRWRLIETRSWRFYPIEDDFWDRWSRVNGIFKHHVEGLPTFAEKWIEIEPYLRDALLVAHNAPFDVRILCSHLDHHKIERPNASAHCTLKLAGMFLRGAERNLAYVCKSLRIPLQHHNSVSDAVATGRIYAQLHESHANRAAWSPQRLVLSEWTAANRDLDFDDYDSMDWSDDDEVGELSEGLTDKATLCCKLMDECKFNLFEGWAFSITGDLLIERSDFVDLIRKLGAKCGDKGEFLGTARNDHGPTNALIISEQELKDLLDGKSPTKKLKDVLAARNKGKPMIIVPEEHFYDLVSEQVGRSSGCIPRIGFVESDVVGQIAADTIL